MEPANWIVRVYDGEYCVKWWLIKDRTEHEADREAAADFEREFMGFAPSGNEFDWTMVKDKSPTTED